MLLERHLLHEPRPLHYNTHGTCSQWGFGPQAKALQSAGGSSRGETEGRLFMFLYLILHRDRITITQWLGAHMQIIFL